MLEESVKDYWDYYSTMKTANRKGHAEGLAEGLAEGMAKGRAEGLAKGRAEGLAEGRAEGHMDVARKLKSMGFSDEDIAHATGLTLDEVKQLH